MFSMCILLLVIIANLEPKVNLNFILILGYTWPMKIKTNWDLGLLYKSSKDQNIEKDIHKIEEACLKFEKKYRGKDYLSSPEKLFKALEDYEELNRDFQGHKPYYYFSIRTELNSEDTEALALATKIEQRINLVSNKIKFFNLEIGKLEQKKQNLFLNHPKLASHKYFLYKIFRAAKYKLSEKEEQLASLLSQTSYSMWTDSMQKILSKQTVELKGKQVPISEASGKLQNLPKEERKKLQERINEKLKSVSHTAESEINAIYNYKKIMDERRGYENAYTSTVIKYENQEKDVENLVSLITRNFKISHRFYKLHTKLLKEKKIFYHDRAVKIGKISKKFSFEKSVDIVRKALGNVDKEYIEIFDSYLSKGQIDVYPKKGKRGGAFCSKTGNLPTFVLLNHTDDIRSVETMGHEMGHAIHGEMTQTQPLRYQLFPISTAEVASTFFEQVTQEEIENNLSDKEKIIMLHNRIAGDIQTIFRQIACFNFEKELHERIREEGQISASDMAKLMKKHLESYLGDTVEVTEGDGYSFISWHHIRSYFYVYSYAYGQIISKSLFENWRKDPIYAGKVKQFLKAGKSMSPEDIFESIGIDTSKPDFFLSGLKSIEKDISRLEKLTH